MLSARSFGELVARYKYLHLLALRDRSLVGRVEQLRDEVEQERDRARHAAKRARGESQRQAARRGTAARARARARDEPRADEARGESGRGAPRAHQGDETQLTNEIASLDAARRRTETARPTRARAASTIKTSDYGKLDWPVDGSLVYTFGKAQTSNNTTIRWNGVGIKASVGTSVRRWPTERW